MADDKKTSTSKTPPPSTSKSKVVRSPKWPALTFDDALNKARVIYKEEKRSSTTANVIYNHLGFQKKTGPAGRALSALQQYGLLDEHGGQYKISDKVFRFFHLPEDSPERETIRKELALRPRLFKELLAKYPDGLPSDATLRSYLVLDRNFNENTVEQFIKIFKAAIAVAKPFDGGYTADASDSTDEEESEESDQSMETPTEQEQVRKNVPPFRTPSLPPPPGVKMYEFSFPLSFQRNVVAELRITGESLKRRDLDVLKKKIADLEDAYEEEEETPPARSAVWRNKDHDQPVQVTGEKGVGPDGKRYLAVADSESGIPEDELDFEDEQ